MLRKQIVNYFKIIRIILVFSILFSHLFGCAAIMMNIPAPPNALVKIGLDETDKKEIPAKYIQQLKWASITSDWAIPYVFINVGEHFEKNGEENKAVLYLDRAISEFRNRRDFSGVGTASTRKILLLNKYGERRESLEAIKELENAGLEAPPKAFVFYNLGHYYLTAGNYIKAKEYYEQSLKYTENVQNDLNVLVLRRDAVFENGIALFLGEYFSITSDKYNLDAFSKEEYSWIQRNAEKSIFLFKDTLVLNKEIKKQRTSRFISDKSFYFIEASAYNYMGLAFALMKRFNESEKAVYAAEKLSLKANNYESELNNLLVKSQIFLLAKMFDKVEETALQLNEIAEKYQLEFYKMWAQYILSFSYKGKGDEAKAINCIKSAVAIMEEQDPEIVKELFDDSYTFRPRVFYDALVDSYIKHDNIKAALETAERSKNNAICNLLSGTNIGRSIQETKLLNQLANAKREMAFAAKAFASAVKEEDSISEESANYVERARQYYVETMKRIKNHNDELFSIIKMERFSIDGIRKMLDENTTIFSYYLTRRNLYILAITHEKIFLGKMNITENEIYKIIFSFNSATVVDKHETSDLLSEKLYNLFLKQVMPFVVGDRLIIIPHGSLYYLPFEAISLKQQYLVDVFSVFYLPSISVLKYILSKESSTGPNAIVFIHSDSEERKMDLLHFVTEADSVRNVFPQANIILKGESTKTKIKSVVSNCDILHFATNCCLAKDDPLQSGISLTPSMGNNDCLQVDEIFRMKFRGRLIMMSACKAEMTNYSTGLEIAAFNRALIYAGSPSVISTLWKVDEKAKGIFMDIFYTNLDKSENIAALLKVTKNFMIKSGYPPSEWAAFVLNGNN